MSTHTLDDSPLTPYHARLIIACAGGPFLDGYLLSIIAIALIGAQRELNLRPAEVGLAGAVSMIGLFAGSLLFGPLTDRIGRRVMYTADLLVMLIASAACLLIETGWELVALRLLIGVAVGADYPIATALLTEWIPKQRRGTIIGLLGTVWLIGAVAASLVGYVLVRAYGYESWRWLLASGAVFAFGVLLFRTGMLESPRWLVCKGRTQQALTEVSAAFGRTVTNAELMAMVAEEGGHEAMGFAQLFQGAYLRRIAFCGLFWMVFAIAQFVLYTDGPLILSDFGFGNGNTADTVGQIVITGGFLFGSLPGLWLVERIGRRPLILWSFALATLTIAPLGLWPRAEQWLLMTCFFFFSFVNGAGSILVFIYPNELFPTRVRASAVGIATAISRIGAAAGTYLVPVFAERLGSAKIMLAGSAVVAFGFVVSYFMAEETKGRPLSTTATATSFKTATDAR